MLYDRETHARWGRQLSLPAAMMFRKRRGHTVYVCKLWALGTVREPVRRLRHDRSRSTRIQKSHLKLQPHSPSWQCCPFPPPPVLQSVEEGVDISLLCSYAMVVLSSCSSGRSVRVKSCLKFGNYYNCFNSNRVAKLVKLVSLRLQAGETRLRSAVAPSYLVFLQYFISSYLNSPCHLDGWLFSHLTRFSRSTELSLK